MSSNQAAMLWKVEPLSPSGTPRLDDINEEWLCFDEKPVELENRNAEIYTDGLTRAQVATKYLEELELKQWIKEESFADWLEEKIDLPIFEELPVPECGQNRAVVYSVKHQHNAEDATQSLLREFETVLGDVQACHQVVVGPSVVSTLTPPQSPPPAIVKQQQQQQQQHLAAQPSSAHLLVSLQPIHHHHQHHVDQPAFVYGEPQHHEEQITVSSVHGHHHPESYAVSTVPLSEPQIVYHRQTHEQQITDQWNAENLSLDPLVHSGDVAHELAKVDEYVRSCAEDAAGTSSSTLSTSSSSSPPSPCTSSNASCMSSEDSADDPDWSFESLSPPPGRRTTGGSLCRQGRRAKPYSRPTVEDKRVRKKEQNKNAATRYRQKKKQEIKKILGEEQELADRNEKLQVKVKDLQREIGYLKGLMRDLFKAKGLIK